MEPYIVIVQGIRGIIETSCLAEAKYKAKKWNAQLIGLYPIEDYKLIKSINQLNKLKTCIS
jgi:hypothetical protein